MAKAGGAGYERPSYTESELYWAVATTTGTSLQPKAQLYVDTADPGNVYKGTVIADWPKSGSDPQYGTCGTTKVGRHILGQNSPACAWQYGYNRAAQDVAWLANELSYVIVGRDPPFHTYFASTPVAERDPNAIGRFDLAVFISATERKSRQVQRAGWAQVCSGYIHGYWPAPSCSYSSRIST